MADQHDLQTEAEALAALRSGRVWLNPPIGSMWTASYFVPDEPTRGTAPKLTPIAALSAAARALGLTAQPAPQGDAHAILNRWQASMDNPAAPPLEVHHADLAILRAALTIPPAGPPGMVAVPAEVAQAADEAWDRAWAEHDAHQAQHKDMNAWRGLKAAFLEHFATALRQAAAGGERDGG